MSETGKVEKEDGSPVWISDDGREYKSKSGMWKRNKKLKSESTPNESDAGATKEEGQPEVDTSKSADRDSPPSEPSVDWVNMDFGDAPVTEVIPAPL